MVSCGHRHLKALLTVVDSCPPYQVELGVQTHAAEYNQQKYGDTTSDCDGVEVNQLGVFEIRYDSLVAISICGSA
jgi:hypothetical protein